MSGGHPVERPPFDVHAEYEVTADFIIDGPTHIRGEAFDKSLVSTRLLRRLYAIGLIRIRAAASDRRETGPVRFVPTARTGRAR